MGAAGKIAKTIGSYAIGGAIPGQVASAAGFGQDDLPPGVRQVTKREYDAAIADWSKSHSVEGGDTFPQNRPGGAYSSQSDYNAGLQSFKDTMSVLPPPAPDLADETVQRARQAARRKLLMGGLTGPLDLSGGATTKLPGLGGT